MREQQDDHCWITAGGRPYIIAAILRRQPDQRLVFAIIDRSKPEITHFVAMTEPWWMEPYARQAEINIARYWGTNDAVS